MSRIPHVRDLTTAPLVGCRYRVPCIQPHRPELGRLWVPVLGPEHADPELGVPHPHWHYDVRFIGARLYRRLFGLDSPGKALNRLEHLPGAVLAERVLVCRRQHPVHIFAIRQFSLSAAARFRQMEDRAAAGRVNPAHPICPHRGIPLCGAPVIEKDGRRVWVCPGHALMWDVETGELVRRAEAQR